MIIKLRTPAQSMFMKVCGSWNRSAARNCAAKLTLARATRVRQNAAAQDTSASLNVKDFQRRVVGVLPIAANVPHTGNSYRFVRPLAVDEETTLSFRYKSK